MKKILFFLLLPCVLFGQDFPEEMPAAVAVARSVSVVDDTTLVGTLTGVNDVMGYGLSADSVQVGDKFIDAAGRIHTIEIINSRGLNSLNVQVVTTETVYFEFSGRGVLWRPDGTGLIPVGPAANGMVSDFLSAKIHNHNLSVLSSGGGSSFVEYEVDDLPTSINANEAYRIKGRGWYDYSATLPSGYVLGESAFQVESNYLLIRVEGNVSVNQFGAVGDGTTDDLPAFQAAIDFAVAQGYTGITIPDGTFALGGDLDFPAVDGFTISGQGKYKSAITFQGDAAVNMHNQSELKLSSLTVTGDAAVSISVRPVDDVTMRNIYIENVLLDKRHETMGVGNHGIVIDGNRAAGAFTKTLSHVYILGCDVFGAGHPEAFDGTDGQGRDNIYIRYYPNFPGDNGSVHDVYIDNCNLDGASRMNLTVAGLDLGAGSGGLSPEWKEPYNVFVSNTSLKNSTWASLDIEDGDNVFVNNCHFENGGRNLDYFDLEFALADGGTGDNGLNRAFRSVIAKGQGAEGLYVTNSQFSNCAYLSAPPKGSVFTSCTFLNTPIRNADAASYMGVEFTSCYFLREDTSTLFIGDHLVDLYASDAKFTDCKFEGDDDVAMIELSDGEIARSDRYSVDFKACTFIGSDGTLALIDYGNVRFLPGCEFYDFQTLTTSEGNARYNRIHIDGVKGYSVQEIYEARFEGIKKLSILNSEFDSISQITSSTQMQPGDLIVRGNDFGVYKPVESYLSAYFLRTRSFDHTVFEHNTVRLILDATVTAIELIERQFGGEDRESVSINHNTFTGWSGKEVVRILSYNGEQVKKASITNNIHDGITPFVITGLQTNNYILFGNGGYTNQFLKETSSGLTPTTLGWSDIANIPAGFSDDVDNVDDADADPTNELDSKWTEDGGSNIRRETGSVSIGVNRSNVKFHVVGKSTFGADVSSDYRAELLVAPQTAFSLSPTTDKGILISAPSGTSASDGAMLGSLFFSPVGLTRAHAGIVAYQDGGDADFIGLKMIVHTSSSSGADGVEGLNVNRVGRVFFPQYAVGQPAYADLTGSPDYLAGFNSSGQVVPVTLSAIQDDADADPTNELDSKWTEDGGSNIRRETGSVSIGVNRSNEKFHVVGKSTFGADVSSDYNADVIISTQTAFDPSPTADKTLLLSANGITPADGQELGSLFFSPGGISRAHAGITAFQDGADSDYIGLRFWTHVSNSAGVDAYDAGYFDRVGRFHLNRIIDDAQSTTYQGLVGYNPDGQIVGVNVDDFTPDGNGVLESDGPHNLLDGTIIRGATQPSGSIGRFALANAVSAAGTSFNYLRMTGNSSKGVLIDLEVQESSGDVTKAAITLSDPNSMSDFNADGEWEYVSGSTRRGFDWGTNQMLFDGSDHIDLPTSSPANNRSYTTFNSDGSFEYVPEFVGVSTSDQTLTAGGSIASDPEITVSGIPAGTYEAEVVLNYESSNINGELIWTFTTVGVDAARSTYRLPGQTNNVSSDWTVTSSTAEIITTNQIHSTGAQMGTIVFTSTGTVTLRRRAGATGNITLREGSRIRLKKID
jgi:hypothetical protein